MSKAPLLTPVLRSMGWANWVRPMGRRQDHLLGWSHLWDLATGYVLMDQVNGTAPEARGLVSVFKSNI